MAMELELNPVETLTASSPSIETALFAVDVTPDMIKAAGSERSARYAAITASLSKNDRAAQYAKCVLYSEWKAGFKEEKNSLYKSVTDIAANCGESRQLFGNLAKVGAKFFSDEHPTNKEWTYKEYSPHTLFELSILPDNILSIMDTVLSQYGPEPGTGFYTVSQTQAREIKNAWNALKKADRTDEFANLFLYKDRDGEAFTLYPPEEFINRVCGWKLIIAVDSEAEESDAARSTSNEQTADSNTIAAEKSGFSTFTFIRNGVPAVSRIYSDGTESQLLKHMGGIGYKVLATQSNKQGLTRTFVRYNDGNAEIVVVGVFPLSVKSLQIDVEKYNTAVKEEMTTKGAAQYFRPYTIAEYVEAVQTDTFVDNI